MKAKVRYTVENGRSGILKIGSGRVPMGGTGTFELSPAQLAELRNTALVALTKSTTTTASDDTKIVATTTTDTTHTARSSRATKGKEKK